MVIGLMIKSNLGLEHWYHNDRTKDWSNASLVGLIASLNLLYVWFKYVLTQPTLVWFNPKLETNLKLLLLSLTSLQWRSFAVELKFDAKFVCGLWMSKFKRASVSHVYWQFLPSKLTFLLANILNMHKIECQIVLLIKSIFFPSEFNEMSSYLG